MEKRICILYTGGTIGMVPTPRGYAPRPGYLGPLLAAMPELKGPEAPAWDLVEMDPLLDSSNIAVGEWNAIGRAIFERYNDYDGFVVLHGTDTMAYTAGALSFMLENLQKPVVLTGSQIPLCRLRSDGRENLITSLLIAALGRGAALAPFDNVPIGVLKVFPGIQFDLFEPIMTRRLRGIVLETFGAGNIPDEQGALPPLIQKAWQNGAVLTVCSQCFEGGVLLGEYAASAALTAAGAVSGGDMTTEAAVAKLYYLFSKGLDAAAVKEKMGENLRGERSGSLT